MPVLTSTPILVTSSSTYLLSQIIVLHTSQSKFSSPRDALLATSKLIGGCHALLAGGLALRDVLDRKWIDHDLITTKSTFGDGIVALEAGYLIGDTVFLLWKRKTLRDPRFLRRVISHHLIVAGLMLAYLRAAARGRASGIFFVSSFMASFHIPSALQQSA